jgi:16S rRNA (cytosine967-C5)-methyltransferase
MTSASPSAPLWRQLQAAAEVIAAVRAGRSTTQTLEGLEPALRSAAQALSFHALRCLGLAQALREQLARRAPPPHVDALLCTALALAARPESEQGAGHAPHTLVSQAVEAAKQSPRTQHQASFINGCLRRFLREREALVQAAERLPEARWNHPAWWIQRLRQDHPGHWQAILEAGNSRAPLTLRVHPRRGSRSQFLQALAAQGLAARPVGAHGVELARSVPVTSLPGYADGHFSVQDAGAQLAAPLLLQDLQAGAAEPLRLLDACAAPGGKTAHLLELADAQVLALDVDPARCQRITQNLQRLGLQAQVRAADAADTASWWDGRPFDGILLDAPCTASGIARRHPDVRWLRRPSDVAQLVAQQARLLAALWPLLKPGGQLLYCTCSVFQAEGEQQIQTFLAHHKDAQMRPSPGHLLPLAAGAEAQLPDNPSGEHDGFYYARLGKRAA